MLFALFLCRKQSESFDEFWRCIVIKEQQINEEIRDKEVRLIGENGEQLGIMSAKQALELATAQELDLVKISPNAVPPVCKIMDYGKYKYESAKREKESKKKQKVINVKEIRLTPSIDKHDIEVKAKHANNFLKGGDKVKVSVRFRGRELGHTEIGKLVLNKFKELTEEYGNVEKDSVMEGRNMTMFLSPKQQD